MSDPSVAVVVVSYNAGEDLGRCVGTLSTQVRAPERVCIVDNGSEDGCLDRLPIMPRGSEILRLGCNTGFAAAANRGIERSEGCEWVALLNPDAFPEPGWLDSLLRAARARPDFTLFASRQLMADDPSRFDGAGDVYAVSGLAWRRFFGQPAVGAADKSEEVFGPCAAAALYRRDVLLEMGGFDETFFCYFEDVDLAFRARLLGHRCLYVPGAVVHHVGSSVSGRHSSFALYHGHRNLVWTWWKNMPLTLLGPYLPHHLMLNATTLLHFAAHGLGGPVARAKCDAFKGLPALLRRRRRTQASRRVEGSELRRVMASGAQAFGLHRHG